MLELPSEVQPCGDRHPECQVCCGSCSYLHFGKFCKFHKPTETIISMEPYVGWRLFDVNEIGLCSLTRQDYVWQPGVNEASCYAYSRTYDYNDNEQRRNLVENVEHMRICSCGFYSFNTNRSADIIYKFLGKSHTYIASIYVWGNMVKYVDGWRSQYAKIKRVYTSYYEGKKDFLSIYESSKYPVGRISHTVGVSTLIRNKVRKVHDVHLFSMHEYWNTQIKGRFLSGILDAYWENTEDGIKLNILIP